MRGLAFYIDKITGCIEKVSTGHRFETEVVPVNQQDLKNVLKKNGWSFSWKSFLKMPSCEVYQLLIRSDKLKQIQGLISMEIKEDFIELHHIENAPHNFGAGKQFAGVCANLVAFACKKS